MRAEPGYYIREVVSEMYRKSMHRIGTMNSCSTADCKHGVMGTGRCLWCLENRLAALASVELAHQFRLKLVSIRQVETRLEDQAVFNAK